MAIVHGKKIDKNPKTQQRFRRAWQRLLVAANEVIPVVEPLYHTSIGGVTGMAIRTAAKFATGTQADAGHDYLAVVPGDASLELIATGLSVQLADASIELLAGGVAVQLADASLELLAGGVSVQIGDDSLQLLAGGVAAKLDTVAGGLGLTANGLFVDLATDGGLTWNATNNGQVFWRGFRVYSGNPASLADGDAWFDSSDGGFKLRYHGQSGSIVGRLGCTSSNSSAIANTTTETIFDKTITVKADVLRQSVLLRVVAYGTYESDGVSGAEMNIKWGSTDIFYHGNFVVLHTAGWWWMEAYVYCLTEGATGTVRACGQFCYDVNDIEVGVITSTTIDTTADADIGVSWDWDTANASNTATLTHLHVEVMQ